MAAWCAKLSGNPLVGSPDQLNSARIRKIKSTRTAGGHRRYDLAYLISNKSDTQLTVGYARVSSHEQKADLTRQIIVLESYCAKHGWGFEIIQDLGSGMNYKKKGLIRLIKLITSYQVERLVLTHKDR